MRLCKSSLITKLIILAVMIYAAVTIVTLQPKIDEQRNERDALRSEVAELEQKNLEVQAEIDSLGTVEAIKRIARERLNLVSEGEIVYIDSSK